MAIVAGHEFHRGDHVYVDLGHKLDPFRAVVRHEGKDWVDVEIMRKPGRAVSLSEEPWRRPVITPHVEGKGIGGCLRIPYVSPLFERGFDLKEYTEPRTYGIRKVTHGSSNRTAAKQRAASQA